MFASSVDEEDCMLPDLLHASDRERDGHFKTAACTVSDGLLQGLYYCHCAKCLFSDELGKSPTKLIKLLHSLESNCDDNRIIEQKENFFNLPTDKEFIKKIMRNTVDNLKILSIPNGSTNDVNHLGLVYLKDSTQPKIKVYMITWNMQGRSAPKAEDIKLFLPLDTHHIYCFSTQECERSIEASVINSSKVKWEATLLEVMGRKYSMLKSHTMSALHIAIFIRKELVPLISDVESFNVSTGFANLGNKGSVSVSFNFSKTSLMFINSHLPGK